MFLAAAPICLWASWRGARLDRVGAGWIASVTSLLLLSALFWAFGTFQIGMSRGNAVQFGATAGPVLLLWIDSSWYVLLFQFEGVAERWLTMDDWAHFRETVGGVDGYPDVDAAISVDEVHVIVMRSDNRDRAVAQAHPIID